MAGRSGRPPVSSLWFRARVACARDATADLLTGSALVLVPHPDDEAIACGLVVAAKAAQGVPVRLVLATDGRGGWFSDAAAPGPDAVAAVRRDEWHRSLDALGVPGEARHELAFRDGGLAGHEADLCARVARYVDEFRPSQVFVSGPDDLHPDHRALARAACRAVTAVFGPHDAAPPLYAYRVYPAAGMGLDAHSAAPFAGRPSAGRIISRMVVSSPRLVCERALAFRSPESVMAKREAVAAYSSQRRLLDGELRYVWRSDVELFSRLEPARARSA